VISPNYRGSTGYGKEFQQANLFDMGGGDYKTCCQRLTGSSRPVMLIPKS